SECGDKKLRISARFLLGVAFVAIAIASWQLSYVDGLREDYLRQRRTIEVFEAIYFGNKAASVIYPALLAFFVCQLMAPIVHVTCGNQTNPVAFWTLWFLAWVTFAFYCYALV